MVETARHTCVHTRGKRLEMCGRKRESGFSLMELVVVMAVLATLAAIAIPAFAGWLPNFRLKNAARDVASNLQLARLTAVKKNVTCPIAFNQIIGGDLFDYIIFEDANGNLEYDTGETIVTQVLWDNYGNVLFDSAQGGGDGVTFWDNALGCPAIAFLPNGLPADGSPLEPSAGGTVFLKNTKNKSSSVVLSPVGNVTVNS